MTKRTERAERTQAENGPGPEPEHLVEPRLAGMTTTRQHLLAWVHAQGLAALDELFHEEAVALAASGAAHPSSLGRDGDGADVRRPTRAGSTTPSAANDRRGSDPAVGGGVSGPGPADRADDATAPCRGVDAPLRGQSRGAAERPVHPEQ